jgi:hypothetical protein
VRADSSVFQNRYCASAQTVMCNYMKTVLTTIFTVIFTITFQFSFGQKLNEKIEKVKLDTIDGGYIPKNLEDCFLEIDKMLNDSLKTEFKKISEDDFTGKTHFGLGIWMRNNWSLWGSSRLSRYFNEKEIYHPDDMSGIILTSYHRKLTNKNIDLENQINYYKTYWKVAEEPKKKDYPKGVKKIEFNTKQHYTLKENGSPALLHIQSNSKNEKTWIYDYHFGWKEIDKFEQKKLNETTYENREETIREIYGKK